MLRRIPTFFKIQAVILAAPALVLSSSMEMQSIQRQQEAVARAAAVRAAVAVTVAREEAKAIQTTTAERDAARARSGELQGALDAANADRDAKQQKIDELQARVALTSYTTGYGGGGSPQPAVGAGNHMAYGFCTWHVANKRPIPWFGNAIDWWWNARAYGFGEGYLPRPGAIMVTRDSWAGHVAYVESVNGNGSWLVSEMNWAGWNVVDFRTVWPGGTLVGFIY